VLERNNYENIVEQAFQVRISQNKNTNGGGLNKRSRGRLRGGRGGGRNRDSNSQYSVYVDSDTKQKDNHICRGGNWYRDRGRQTFDEKNVQCYNCDKFGYYSYSVGRTTIQTRNVRRMMKHT